MRIVDKTGNLRDWAWLRANYGNVRYLDAGTGRKFALYEVRVTVGPSVCQVTVQDEQGGPVRDQPIAFHWPDAKPLAPGAVTMWRDRAEVQRTSGTEGTTGFGLGGGSYIRDLAAGGPHWIWVLSPTLPSDGIAGVGMLGGTNHEGPLRLTFRLQVTGTPPVPPEPPQPPPDTDLAARVEALERKLRALVAHLQQAPGG